MIKKMDAIRFAIGYETIRIAYRAAREGLDQRALNSETIVRDRWGLGPTEEPPKEPGEDGWSDYDQFWAEVGEVKEESESAVEAIREAFIIALFHHWERNANRWCGVNKYDEAETFAALKATGRQPNEKLLRTLRLLANCLKHGPSTRASGACNQLYSACPHLFLVGPDSKDNPQPPSNEYLLLSGSLVDELFQAVVRSGPPTNSFNEAWELLA